jgi:predicted small secreted protein
MKKLLTIVLGLTVAFSLTACNDADVVSNNISKEADQFRILRRVVFYNGITDEYMLTIEGYCSLGNFDAERELTVTCQTSPGEYKKHFLADDDDAAATGNFV